MAPLGHAGRRRPVSLTVHGPICPNEAWDRYARPGRWSSWAPHITSATATTEVIGEGTKGRVVVLGVLRMRFVVTGVDHAARRWAWRVRCGPLVVKLYHDITPSTLSPGGSTTHVQMTGPRPLVLGYVPLMRWALHRLVSRRA